MITKKLQLQIKHLHESGLQMNKLFSLEQELYTIKSSLAMNNEFLKEIRSKLLDKCPLSAESQSSNPDSNSNSISESSDIPEKKINYQSELTGTTMEITEFPDEIG